MKEYNDVTGKLITSGDWIIYAASAGRSAILKFGVVTSLGTVKEAYSSDLEKCVKAITLDYWEGGRLYVEDGGFCLQNNGKSVRLTFSERIVVIPADRVPEHALRLLRAVIYKYLVTQ